MIKKLFWSESAEFPGMEVGVGAGYLTPREQAAQTKVSHPPPFPVWRKID